MPEPIGVAVIGAGAIAEAHLYAYQRSERAEVRALVDVDEARARSAAERYNVPHVEKDYRHVLTRTDIAAVSICTPPFTHVDMSVEALSAGKHVLCEKPVVTALTGLDAISAAQASSGRVFSGVFQLRFGKGASQLRLLMDEGRMGRLHLGVADTLWYRDDTYYSVPWRGTWAQEGGGVTVSQAIHLIDALNAFLGEPISVYAHAGTFRAPIECDDTCVAVVRYAGGAIGQITSTVSAVGPERTRLEFYGTKLSAVSAGSPYDATAEPFEIGATDPAEAVAIQHELEERVPRGYRMLHRGSVEDFLGAIDESRDPTVGVAECRAALQVTAGIYKSAMTRQPVDLPISPDDPWYHHLPPEGFTLTEGVQ